MQKERDALLRQPTNMMPSTFLGVGGNIIDAAHDNVFSCEIKGNSPVRAYQISIYSNDNESSVIYQPSVVVLPSPFYPYDRKGNLVLFEITVPNSSGMVNGNEYKWTLRTWWEYSALNPDENSVLSTEYVFICRSTPALNILQLNTANSTYEPPIFTGGKHRFAHVVNRRSAEWIGQYSQNEGVGILWFQWTVAQSNDHSKIISETGRLYINSELAYDYDSLLTGVDYSVRLVVQTQDGVQVETPWVDFSVSYPIIDMHSGISVMPTSDDGIKCDWSALKYIQGVPSGDGYRYVLNYPSAPNISVEIDSGTNIVFEENEYFEIDMPIDGTDVWAGRVFGDGLIAKWEGTNESGDPYYMALSHIGIVNGLYPSASLRPSTTLKPKTAYGGKFKFDANGVSAYYQESGILQSYWYVLLHNNSGFYMQRFLLNYDPSSLEKVEA